MYIKKYNLCPQYLKVNFVLLKDVHQYYTKGSRYNFLVPHCRSSDSVTFYHAGIIDWNSLPEWLKELEKSHRFKIALKKFLIKHRHKTELEEFLNY